MKNINPHSHPTPTHARTTADVERGAHPEIRAHRKFACTATRGVINDAPHKGGLHVFA